MENPFRKETRFVGNNKDFCNMIASYLKLDNFFIDEVNDECSYDWGGFPRNFNPDCEWDVRTIEDAIADKSTGEFNIPTILSKMATEGVIPAGYYLMTE